MGLLLVLLALIINGTFRLRREVDEIKADRDYWRKHSEEMEARLEDRDRR